MSNNKFLSLQTAKFSFCYENAEGPDGYITEKILDCLIAGVVPIYWGPKNINHWINEDIFIKDLQTFNILKIEIEKPIVMIIKNLFPSKSI